MKHIGLVRSRVNRRPIRYEMKTVSCKRDLNDARLLQARFRLQFETFDGKIATKFTQHLSPLLNNKVHLFQALS